MELMTEHKGKKNTIANFLPKLQIIFRHFLKKRDTMETMILMIIMVVMGKYIFRLGLSMTISPGRRPIGNFPSQGQRSPIARNTPPKTINVFCMTFFTINLSEIGYQSSDNSCSKPFTILPSASLPKCFIIGAMACMGLLYAEKSIFSLIQAMISSRPAIFGRYDSSTCR